MPIDQDTKVFDVTRPNRTQPDATSRPLIVGHHPQTSDPMVNADSAPASDSTPSSEGTPIHVAMADEDAEHEVIQPTIDGTAPDKPSIAEEGPEDFSSLTAEHDTGHEDNNLLADHNAATPETNAPTTGNDTQPEHEPEPQYTSVHSLISSDSHEPQDQQVHFTPQTSHDDTLPQTQPLPTTRGAGPHKRWPKVLGWLLVILVLAVVGGYLAIDAGLVSSNIKLPFHIFNMQKSSSPQASTTSTPPAAPSSKPAPTPASTVPTGFTAYILSGTSISFDYPTAWGAPVVKTDPGYSKRATASKSDGTYAYLVNFAANKDIQAAFTSSKYLPPARTALYYDFLQWCVGTNDGKFYKQTLHFTTAAGVDTPSTITCDQGPLNDATKIDNQTIMQAKTKDAGGAPLGDLYTQNLTDGDLAVLHVKDATMQNGDNIKTLLTSVKSSSASSTN